MKPRTEDYDVTQDTGGSEGLTLLEHELPIGDVGGPAKAKSYLRALYPTSTQSAAIAESYNSRIRPMMDAIDKIRELGVMKEGIRLPNIVFIGDQSSGKSSVLEALAGISLPKGQGIVTRVPLVLRLQSCKDPRDARITIACGTPGSRLEKKMEISELEVQEAISRLTNELARDKKGVVNSPISLHARRCSGPDLTLVDLPGITRVPVRDQPNDIYGRISEMIKQYIRPKESIILNVLSATVDFPTCESIQYVMACIREVKGVSLPNIYSHPVLQQLLREQISRVAPACLKKVALSVVDKTCSGFPNLARAYRETVSRALGKSQDECLAFVERTLQKSGKVIFTQNVLYMETVTSIRERVLDLKIAATDGIESDPASSDMPDLSEMVSLDEETTDEYKAAQELQINLFAYWNVLLRRLLDDIPMEIRHSFENAMLVDLDESILRRVSQDVKQLQEVMSEQSTLRQKRNLLEASVDILNESLHIVAKTFGSSGNTAY